MKTFVTLCLIFWLGCTGGWILELFYRRLAHKKWINPGFLVGPYLPLYGVGVLLLYLICKVDYSFISNNVLRDIFIIFLITIMMTLIEYITGKIFIVNMKVKLWDYSNQWGNIEGIICPLFSLIWGAIGAIYFFFIHDFICKAVDKLEGNISLAFIVGIFWGWFVIDNIYSFNLVHKLKTFAKKNDIIIHYEQFKEFIREKTKQLHEKSSIILPFKTKTSLHVFLQNYNEKLNEQKEIFEEKIKKMKSKKKDNK